MKKIVCALACAANLLLSGIAYAVGELGSKTEVNQFKEVKQEFFLNVYESLWRDYYIGPYVKYESSAFETEWFYELKIIRHLNNHNLRIGVGGFIKDRSKNNVETGVNLFVRWRIWE